MNLQEIIYRVIDVLRYPVIWNLPLVVVLPGMYFAYELLGKLAGAVKYWFTQNIKWIALAVGFAFIVTHL